MHLKICMLSNIAMTDYILATYWLSRGSLPCIIHRTPNERKWFITSMWLNKPPSFLFVPLQQLCFLIFTKHCFAGLRPPAAKPGMVCVALSTVFSSAMKNINIYCSLFDLGAERENVIISFEKGLFLVFMNGSRLSFIETPTKSVPCSVLCHHYGPKGSRDQNGNGWNLVVVSGPAYSLSWGKPSWAEAHQWKAGAALCDTWTSSSLPADTWITHGLCAHSLFAGWGCSRKLTSTNW